MPFKITTWNVEWMISIFNGDWSDWDKTIRDSFAGTSLGSIRLAPIADVPALCTRIANVIRAVDPDFLCIQEGPPREEQMQLFVDQFLGGDYRVFGSNRRSQRLYILVKNAHKDIVSVQDFDEDDWKVFWTNQPYYPWGGVDEDERGVQSTFRRPLGFRIHPEGAGGPNLFGLNVHTKSKFSKLKRPDQWENRDREAILDALLQRQKLSAEIRMIRAYVEHLIDEHGPNTNVLLLGDLNDGPAAELLEKEFLIHNIVDELAGTLLNPQSRLVHGMNDAALRSSFTTMFHNPLKNGELTQELIDHIMISTPLQVGSAGLTFDQGDCVVETEAYEAEIDDSFDEDDRMHLPSDHLPVSAVFDL